MSDAVTTSTATIQCPDGFVMPALVARPTSADPVPGIVFMFEAFGMNDEMRRLAEVFAGHGFAVVLPDLLARGSWVGCIRRVFADFARGQGRTFDDLGAVRTWLGEQPYVRRDEVAMLGLCIGGGFALLLGRTGQYRAVAPFYGRLPADLTGSCPVVASYGARDRMFAGSADHLRAELERLGVPSDVKEYPEAGHSFMNRPPNRVVGGLMGLGGSGFRPEAAADATARVVAFLREHLPGG